MSFMSTETFTTLIVTVFLSFCHWFLQTSAISYMRLEFDYQMAVYELYEYGDVLSVSGFYRQVQYPA